jgi:hypothetical protein
MEEGTGNAPDPTKGANNLANCVNNYVELPSITG